MIVTIGGIPVYNAIISDEETGMMKISLVDDPAVMSNFQAFDRHRSPQMYAIQDEDKRIVRGVVMRADFPIYRRDDRIGEYYIIYKADQIRLMAEKYLAESRQNDVNLMHQGANVDGVQMVQYFISGDGVSVQGFDDCADGSLFAEFHILDDQIWADIKAGTYKGFSLEGIFDLQPETDVDDVQSIVDILDGAFRKLFKHSKRSEMSKLTKFKAALAKILQEFGNVTTDRGILAWDGDEDLAAGDSVYIEDAEGNRTPAEDGDYVTEDGKTIVVVDGQVSEIKDAESTPANPAVSETEMKAKKVSRFSQIRQAFEDSYEEKERKLIDAIIATLAEGEYAFLVEAGDNYAVANVYSDDNWEGKYIKYAVAWSESGEPSVSDPEEVKAAFVPVADPNPADTAPSAEEMAALKKGIKELKAQIAKMSKMSAAKPAHQEIKQAAEVGKTGIKGLDNLSKLLSAR